jgi:hypothetical protein
LQLFGKITKFWHFGEAKNDNTRDKKEKCMSEGLQRKITSTQLILDLGLMSDALQDLSELSLDLQDRYMYIANKKTQTLVQISEEQRTIPDPYYENSRKAVDSLCFQGVSLHKTESKNYPAIDPSSFYKNLKTSMEKRLLNNDDVELTS